MDIAKIRKNTKQFQALTSLTIAEFDTLLPIFESLWEDWITRFTLSGKPRRRRYVPRQAEGLSSVEDKLFFILCYYKTATLQEYHAAAFGLGQDMANKWVHVLAPLLEKATQRWKPASSPRTLHTDQECALDGTESPIERPTYEQQTHYSGKKKGHTYKHLLLVALTGTILWLSPCAYGKVHDKRMAEAMLPCLPTVALLHVDLGFLGYHPDGPTIIIPEKKPRGGKLTAIQRANNRQKARKRVFAEHAIGHVKTCRIVKDKNRNRKVGFREMAFKTAIQLHNFRCQARRVILL